MIANIFGENPITGLDEQFRIDPVSKTVVTTDLLHYLRHLGLYYHHKDRIIGFSNGSVYDHLLVVPPASSNTDIHLGVIEVAVTSAPCTLDVYEDTTVSALGTLTPSYNLNRNSPNTSLLQVYHAPTVVTVGTLLGPALVIGTKQEGGAGHSGFPELILKRGAKYLLRFTNNSTATIDMDFDFEWVDVPFPT